MKKIIFILVILILSSFGFAFEDIYGTSCSTTASEYNLFNDSGGTESGAVNYDFTDVLNSDANTVVTMLILNVIADTDASGNPGVFAYDSSAQNFAEIGADYTTTKWNYRTGGDWLDSGFNSDHNIEYNITFNIDLVPRDINYSIQDNLGQVNLTNENFRYGTETDVAYFSLASLSGTHTFTGLYVWNGTKCPELVLPDTIPPAINQSSYNVTSAINEGNRTAWRTNLSYPVITTDSTPTITFNINETGNCSISNIDGNYTNQTTDIGVQCVTEDTTQHTCTVGGSEAIPEGQSKLFISCIDLVGNENISSTSSNLTIQLDTTPPVVSLNHPINNSTSTSFTVLFNVTPVEQTAGLANCSLWINETDWTLRQTNYTCNNATDCLFSEELATEGNYTWNVECCDTGKNCGFNDTNYTNWVDLDVNVSLSFDGLNQSRKYEYFTVANVTANMTGCTGCTLCVDVDDAVNNVSTPLGNKNYSCGTEQVSFLYNITKLRQDKFNQTMSIINITSNMTVNITLDNRTDIQIFQFNITNNKTVSENITIEVDNDGVPDVNLLGKLNGIKLLMDWFYDSTKTNKVNLSRSTAGTKTIYMNISTQGFQTDGNVENFSFQLNGFSIDVGNSLNFTENFTDSSKFSGTYGANISLFSDIEDFYDNDSSAWSTVTNQSSGETLSIVNPFTGNSYLHMVIPGFDTENPNSRINEWRESLPNFDLRSAYQFNSTLTSAYSFTTYPNAAISFSRTITLTDGTNEEVIWQHAGSGSSSSSGSSSDVLDIWGNKTSAKNIDIYLGGTYSKSISFSSFDPAIKPYLKFNLNFENTAGAGRVSFNSNYKLYNLSVAGISLNMQNSNYTTNETNYTSVLLNNTTNNIKRATLSADIYNPDNTTITYFLSNTNSTSWEEVTNNLVHPFISVGNNISARFQFKSDNETRAPIIYSYNVTITPTAVTNIFVDVGSDGQNDWNYTGTLNTATSPQHFRSNGSYVYDYIQDNCVGNISCYIPLTVTFGTAGTIQISNYNLSVNPNPINITPADVEPFNPINLSFNFTGGSFELSNLELDYLGSRNISFFAYYSKHQEFNDTQVMQVKYSKFNVSLPVNVSYWEAFPSSKDSVNVTPYGQTNLLNIWNLTSQAYDDPMHIYLKTNESLNSCLNIWFSDNGTEKNYGDNLVLYLPFHQGDKLHDYSGKDNDATNNGATWTSNGNVSGGYEFDGVNDYIDLGTDSSLDLTNSTTISIWGKRKANKAWQMWITKGTTGYQVMDYSDSGKVNVRWGSDVDTIQSDSALSLNEWHNIIVTYNESLISLYVNGVLNNSIAHTTSANIVGDSLDIGQRQGSFFFNGTIDEVKIFNYSLSSAEVLTEYNTQEESFRLNISNTSHQVANNLSVGNSIGQWNYVDLNNCSNRFEINWFYWSSICSSCVKTSEYDETNLIET